MLEQHVIVQHEHHKDRVIAILDLGHVVVIQDHTLVVIVITDRDVHVIVYHHLVMGTVSRIVTVIWGMDILHATVQEDTHVDV